MEGYLRLQTRKGYSKSWVVLDKQQLACYASFDLEQQQPTAVLRVMLVADCELLKYSGQDVAHGLQIRGKKDKISLDCVDAAVCSTWFNVLKRATNLHKEEEEYLSLPLRHRTTLEMDPGAPLSRNAVIRAYKKLCLREHPDRGGNADNFNKINIAYNALLAYQQFQEDLERPTVQYEAIVRKKSGGQGLGIVVIEDKVRRQIVVQRVQKDIEILGMSEESEGEIKPGDVLVGIDRDDCSRWLFSRVRARLGPFRVPVGGKVLFTFERISKEDPTLANASSPPESPIKRSFHSCKSEQWTASTGHHSGHSDGQFSFAAPEVKVKTRPPSSAPTQESAAETHTETSSKTQKPFPPVEEKPTSSSSPLKPIVLVPAAALKPKTPINREAKREKERMSLEDPQHRKHLLRTPSTLTATAPQQLFESVIPQDTQPHSQLKPSAETHVKPILLPAETNIETNKTKIETDTRPTPEPHTPVESTLKTQTEPSRHRSETPQTSEQPSRTQGDGKPVLVVNREYVAIEGPAEKSVESSDSSSASDSESDSESGSQDSRAGTETQTGSLGAGSLGYVSTENDTVQEHLRNSLRERELFELEEELQNSKEMQQRLQTLNDTMATKIVDLQHNLYEIKNDFVKCTQMLRQSEQQKTEILKDVGALNEVLSRQGEDKNSQKITQALQSEVRSLRDQQQSLLSRLTNYRQYLRDDADPSETTESRVALYQRREQVAHKVEQMIRDALMQ